MTRLPLIVHLDADAFFVSVEQALDPSLRGKKVAVGGRQRGIISSASYEARACGVYTPMPTSRALRVCPDLILVKHSVGKYGEFSKKLFSLCENLTPLVEPRSIDEGFIDLSMCGLKSVEAVATTVKNLQQRIAKELGLSISFGIATNKLVAGIASKLNKPRGFTLVEPGAEAAFLAPLDLGRLPGIGKKTEATLAAQGLAKVSDLFERSDSELASLFGSGWRGVLAMARGEDDSQVVTTFEDAKSYSQQETFGNDVSDKSEIERTARGMVDELLVKLRADKKRARTLTLKIRYPDFEHSTAGHSLDAASDLETAFYPWIAPLLKKCWTQRRPLRLVAVRLSSVEEAPAQLEMFAENDEKRERLARVMDKIQGAKGANALMRGWKLGKPE